MKSLRDRFFEKVKVDLDGCWLWQGSLDDSGYGMFWIHGGSRRSHIVSWEMVHGEVPTGLQLDHVCHSVENCVGGPSCKHRRCVNPDHLKAVPRDWNIARGHHRTEAGQAACAAHQRNKTHCAKGHEYSEENTTYRFGKSGVERRCKACDREYQRCRSMLLKQ